MLITLIAIENHPPTWTNEGFQDYAKRLPKRYQLKLVSLPAEKRGKNAPITAITAKEGERILNAIPAGNQIIALDRQGIDLTTQHVATRLQQWHDADQSISLLIGGPEGLSPKCLEAAHQTWSLSRLTFPHPLVKVIVAEQLYRAWSLIHNHPYHR